MSEKASRNLKWFAAALLCVVLAMGLATGLPYWLFITKGGQAGNVGLWKACVAGIGCEDVDPDTLPYDAADELRFCRAGSILTILFAAAAAVAAIVMAMSSSPLPSAVRVRLAVPTVLALLFCIVTIAVFCGGLLPWYLHDLEESREAWSWTAGVSFYFLCLSTFGLLVSLGFIVKMQLSDDTTFVNAGAYAPMHDPTYPIPAARYAAYPQQGYAPAPIPAKV